MAGRSTARVACRVVSAACTSGRRSARGRDGREAPASPFLVDRAARPGGSPLDVLAVLGVVHVGDPCSASVDVVSEQERFRQEPPDTPRMRLTVTTGNGPLLTKVVYKTPADLMLELAIVAAGAESALRNTGEWPSLPLTITLEDAP